MPESRDSFDEQDVIDQLQEWDWHFQVLREQENRLRMERDQWRERAEKAEITLKRVESLTDGLDSSMVPWKSWVRAALTEEENND